MLASLRPYHCRPYRFRRRFIVCKSHSSSPPDPPPLNLNLYRESFAKRMAMAGIRPHHRIALGVSGGPDSTALCVLTAGWKSDGLGLVPTRNNDASGFIDGLLGIVVDHKLRPESSEEADLVRDRVSKLGISCVVECCDWSRGKPKLGHLQEEAREMRYRIFQSVCIEKQIGILLIAHHADDQAELFILRLSRNSGVLGLAGMAFITQLFPTHSHCCLEGNKGILLVRPMLEFSKDDMYEGYPRGLAITPRPIPCTPQPDPSTVMGGISGHTPWEKCRPSWDSSGARWGANPTAYRWPHED